MFTILLLVAVSTWVKGEYPKPQTPTELHELFFSYYLDKNLEGIMTLFHENSTFVINDEGNIATGKKEIAEEIQLYLAFDGEIEHISKSIYVNENLALVKAKWKITGDKDLDTIEGEAVEIMIYEDGGWLYFIDNPNGY